MKSNLPPTGHEKGIIGGYMQNKVTLDIPHEEHAKDRRAMSS